MTSQTCRVRHAGPPSPEPRRNGNAFLLAGLALFCLCLLNFASRPFILPALPDITLADISTLTADRFDRIADRTQEALRAREGLRNVANVTALALFIASSLLFWAGIARSFPRQGAAPS